MEDAAATATTAAQDACFGAGSVAGAVIGTFLTTLVLLAVAALLYRQWRRHKGKHLVLVTDPEIVEDAYAFDNPCFKDATPAVGRVTERPLSAVPGDTPAKDSTRWSTPWTSLGLGSAIRNDKRRTLDDSYVGPKATRVSVVSLRSRDFTGLGFNVCGNMREGIFVKDLLHRGPASESGLIHPGDRISSVKISFRNMVYEDALTILSYASPYDVELEVESGGNGSKPTTLLKKSVGPSSTRICHPLYRSQSIPELSQAHKSVAKRLFMADPNDSVGSNYSTMNSTQKSSKSTPASNQSLERRHDETKNNHHHKFGIKVLPALDGTVHRIENQNEHNTNLERRHSRKMDAEKLLVANRHSTTSSDTPSDDRKIYNESFQQRDDPTRIAVERNVDESDKDSGKNTSETINIPSEVPAEVHNAAMAARRNRKSYPETLKTSSLESEGAKSPQKNKRKAPAPPKNTVEAAPTAKKDAMIDTIDSIADYTESLCNYVSKVRDNGAADRQHRLESQSMANRRNSESDTDSEMQNSFTTIELNPADITIHRTPVPEANDDEEDEDDMYRKAASLGDLSKYESKTAATLERAQSLDMTADTSAKKRKAPLPPEDINESTEDLTRLDQIDTFDRRKLKKSNEWGTLEDVIWSENTVASAEADEKTKNTRTRKRSNGTLERSKSAVEIKLKDEVPATTVAVEKQVDVDDDDDNSDREVSIELYNLPLSKRLTQEFIHAERAFNPDADNSLARIVNDGEVVKSPTPEEVELNFQLADEVRSVEGEKRGEEIGNGAPESGVSEKSEDFSRALRYFEMHASASPTPSSESTRVSLSRSEDWKEERAPMVNDASLYSGKQLAAEEPMSKVIVERGCRGCHDRCARHSVDCDREKVNGQRRATPTRTSVGSATSTDSSSARENAERETERTSTPTHLRVHASKAEGINRQKSREDPWEENADKNGGAFSTFQAHRTKFEQRTAEHDRNSSATKSKSLTDVTFDTHFARRVINISENESGNRDGNEDDVVEDEDEYEFGGGAGLRTNNRNLFSPKEEDRRNASNVSNVSVSSGENSEDSGLVRESMDYHPRDSEHRSSSSSPNASQKATYITEIKVSSNREGVREADNENEEMTTSTITSTTESSNGSESRKSLVQRDIKVTSNGKPISGKKPPVPPRRSDIAKSPRDERTSDKHVVYVSEYKSANAAKGPQILDAQPSEMKQSENAGKKFEHWIFVADKEQSRWSAAAAGQPQPVTNIVLSSRDDAN
ncbi:uncharacterized protein DDB_G0283697-like [Odontomachus brunneus]|uniref:uncharacterized protein DDB_G0283697-like n=1 Tax=Odontomachus brunneus TaxID=486640 RepID=UPI0013F235F5|nr:uncharacterized protein DDB_G0283697-like [Odontomachus brunneus]